MNLTHWPRLKMFFLISLLTIGWFVSVSPAQAQMSVWGDVVSGGGATVGLEAFQAIGLGNRDPRVIIASVVQVILGFLGVLAVILIMYGGFVWMTAGGDADKVQRARDILTSAGIGLLIILSAFSIATFVLRALLGASGANPTGAGGINSSGNSSALSAMGNGPIKSVYPSPNQREVPRNTNIIITFRDEINPSTICSVVDSGHCAVNAKLLVSSIKLFEANVGDKSESNLADVKVASSDNKTFVLMPERYLGTPTDKTWYVATLTNQIKKTNGTKIFSIGAFAWQFEVSNILDLTPPQVMSAGVFPAPDNSQDQAGAVIEAIPAKAKLVVNAKPQTFRSWSVSYTKTQGSVEINVTNPKNNSCDGIIELAINNSTPRTANIAYRNMNGLSDNPELAIIDKTIKTACDFDIVLADGFMPGHSWVLNLATQRVADSLVVGDIGYNFVSVLNGDNQILVGADSASTATNIAKALLGHPQVTASANDTTVTLVTKSGGIVNNNLDLLYAGVRDTVTISPFAGGADRSVSVKVMDKKDKPINASVQINFNEAINPMALSGRSEDLKQSIRIVNLANNTMVSGEFILSNQYKTVEFKPDQECGLNGCGEKIYCLPAGANLQVELDPAALATVCATDTDCQSKTPYNSCQNNICYDNTSQSFYPEGKIATGILDLSNNSLDANRDGKVIGPVEYYNENSSEGRGDRFKWLFWTSEVLDLTPPLISWISPNYNQAKVDVETPVLIRFSKLMLSSSLRSGSVIIKKGNTDVEHSLINLISLAKKPVGYWIEKVDEETSSPPDNEADNSTVLIKHSPFLGSNSYRAQIGSGVKDIYQNCYKPSAGPSCQADSSLPDCCNGIPVDLKGAKSCP